MAPSFLDRLRRRETRPEGRASETRSAPARPRRPPTPGQVRRERRALVRAREERLRDLGGLTLEMYKRDGLRPDVLSEQCAEIVEVEQRIQELDGALAALTRRTLGDENRCTCGAPLVSGAHFCANCGRPIGDAPVVVCARCGNPLPAEASYCSNCGRPAEPAEAAAGTEGQEPTIVAEPSPED